MTGPIHSAEISQSARFPSYLKSFCFAVDLAWAQLVYGALGTAVNLSYHWPSISQEPAAKWLLIGPGLAFVIQVICILKFRQGRNWARIGLTVFCLLTLFGLERLVQPPSWEGVLLVLLLLASNLYWMYLVFFTPVRETFWAQKEAVGSPGLVAPNRVEPFQTGITTRVRGFLFGFFVPLMVVLSWLYTRSHPPDLTPLQNDLSTVDKPASPASNEASPLRPSDPLSELQPGASEPQPEQPQPDQNGNLPNQQGAGQNGPGMNQGKPGQPGNTPGGVRK